MPRTIVIAEYQGIKIEAYHIPSVRGRSPDRLWIGIRNTTAVKADKWEVRENLSYVHGVDILLRKKEKLRFDELTPQQQHAILASRVAGSNRTKRAYAKTRQK